MRKSERTQSLLAQIFAQQKKRASSGARTPAAKVARSTKPRTKPAPSVQPPRPSVVAWLKKLPLNKGVELRRSLELTLSLKCGYIVKGALLGHYVLTKEGLQVCFPWATDYFYRSDRMLWEGLCAHGVGHPICYDPSDRTAGIHGCDGCCSQETH